MRAITVTGPGGPDQLALTETADPEPGPGEVLLQVAATAVNRADLLQRQGLYPPPPGASQILGLECSGTIAALGPGTGDGDWRVGDQVCALLSGGGYAEQVAVPVGQLLPIPEGIDLVSAAALPEVGCTVWSNLVQAARLRDGETLLAHGGSSGIGTMAIQVARALGARVAVTASRPAALDACRELGATTLINYADTDFVRAVRESTDNRGADVILDVVGAKYLSRNISALADGGRLVVIGMQGGARAELDLTALMQVRGSVIATALRSRPATGEQSKSDVVAAVRAGLRPLVASGRVRPVIDTVMALADAAAAHARLEAGGHIGKVVLTVGPSSDRAPHTPSSKTTNAGKRTR